MVEEALPGRTSIERVEHLATAERNISSCFGAATLTLAAVVEVAECRRSSPGCTPTMGKYYAHRVK